MIRHFPKFYFFRGGTSDRQFIEYHLSVLPPNLQKVAVDKYENIYQRYFNRNEYARARNEANDFLIAFAINFDRQDEIKTTIVDQSQSQSKSNMGRLSDSIQRCKDAQRSRRKRIID